METLKKLGSFFGGAAWLLGTIGGFGYCVYIKQWPIAVAILILGGMAFPTLKRFIKNLID